MVGVVVFVCGLVVVFCVVFGLYVLRLLYYCCVYVI